MQSTQALEARIEGLERQVRIGRRWILGLGGVLACLGLQALAGPRQSTEVPEVITARMFKVVDKNGKLRATLGPDDTGPNTNALCLWDSISEGRTDLVLRLKASDGGAEIRLPGSVDRGAILISNLVFEKESSVTLYTMCENDVHGLPFGGQSPTLRMWADPDGGGFRASAFRPLLLDGKHADSKDDFFLRSPKESIDRRPR